MNSGCKPITQASAEILNIAIRGRRRWLSLKSAREWIQEHNQKAEFDAQLDAMTDTELLALFANCQRFEVTDKPRGPAVRSVRGWHKLPVCVECLSARNKLFQWAEIVTIYSKETVHSEDWPRD